MTTLTPAVFHVLLALADQDRHGYGIMLEVAERTNQQVQMGPGTLYGTLKRMLEGDLVEECNERIDPDLSDERRRYYRITRQGRRAAAAEAERLQALVRIARAKSVFRTASPSAGRCDDSEDLYRILLKVYLLDIVSNTSKP